FRYIGIAPPLSYTTALESNGARLIPNAFADRMPTEPSLNSLLALDVGYFDALPDSEKDEFFSGRRRNPVAEIFRHNGYRIQTMFQNSFFGRRQGPYVDFYGVMSMLGICDQLGGVDGDCLDTASRRPCCGGSHRLMSHGQLYRSA